MAGLVAVLVARLRVCEEVKHANATQNDDMPCAAVPHYRQNCFDDVDRTEVVGLKLVSDQS